MKKRIALHLIMLAGAVAVFTATAMAKLLPAPPAALNQVP
jgi:hypothetical protein